MIIVYCCVKHIFIYLFILNCTHSHRRNTYVELKLPVAGKSAACVADCVFAGGCTCFCCVAVLKEKICYICDEDEYIQLFCNWKIDLNFEYYICIWYPDINVSNCMIICIPCRNLTLTEP